MEIQEHVSLAPYTTFGAPAVARYFVVVRSIDELRDVLNDELFDSVPYLILGGGSNILFTDSYDGLIIKNEIKGIDMQQEGETVLLSCGAGESWHDIVTYAVERDLWGIENLALIPGSVGAAPIQNIGAYGTELADVLEYVEAVDVETKETVHFTSGMCEFGYRDSIFKGRAKDRYIITTVVLRLSKTPQPNLTYGALKAHFADTKDPTAAEIAAQVCEIRSSKLPDPSEIGNAGSFFKNPLVSQETLGELEEAYGTVPHFVLDDGWVKIPAAWLIEQCDFKGVTRNGVGSYEKQPLVIVRTSGSGSAVASFAREIQQCVKDHFGISLEPEVTIISPKTEV